jgi:hypothetical protein
MLKLVQISLKLQLKQLSTLVDARKIKGKKLGDGRLNRLNKAVIFGWFNGDQFP